VPGARVRPVAHVRNPLRIGFAGQPKRTCACFPDAARGQMQIDDRIRRERSQRRLIDAHRPKCDQIRHPGHERRRGPKFGFRNATYQGDPRGCVIAHERFELVPAFRMRANEFPVNGSFFDAKPEVTIEQRQIGAGPDGQMHRGLFRRFGFSRIHDDAQRSRCFHSSRDPIEGHRMTRRRVRSDEQEQIRMIDIVKCHRRTIRSERQSHSRRGTRHAQTTIRIHMVRSEEPLAELARHVLRFRRQLSGHINCNGRWSVVARDTPELFGDLGYSILG